jgi:hypothetical protein
MGSFDRKIRRKKEKDLNKELSDKVSNILNVPTECSMCQGEFDKTDKEMVTTWRVIVRKQPGETRLYCPPCWEIGQEMVRELTSKLEESTDVVE